MGHAPSASAFHTRITDVEIWKNVIRFVSSNFLGGAGYHAGGDGITREFTLLAPMLLSVLTQHRTTGPYGIAGGENGQPGRQRIVRETSEVVEVGSVDGGDVTPGDRLVLETPGGGGWGSLTLAASRSNIDSDLD